MDNVAIARILREIADLLEIRDDNPFKIRAYRNGADIASNHPHELSQLDEAGLRERAPDAIIEPVGSLRRGCDTCGDLDLLASGATESLMDDFVDYRSVERVLGQGDTKSSVLISGGFQADLRLVAADSRGAAMQYFTGSKPHNIALRDRALGLGFKLNEYGLYRVSDDVRVAGATEEEVYEALGLAW